VPNLQRLWIVFLVSLGLLVGACSKKEKVLRIGVGPGPYGDLVTKAIAPTLGKQGYKVNVVVFQDWVQPNLALANKEIEANVFQHRLYLEKFSKDRNLQLRPGIRIPTAGMGLYSNRLKAVSELKAGDEVTLPLDPTNLARALRFLQKISLLKLKSEIDPTRVTEKDVGENPIGLKLVPTEAAQLPRTLSTAALSVVPGNYAISAGLKLSDALALEELGEDIKIVVATRTEDENAGWSKDITAAIESEDFYRAVESPDNGFVSFQKPDWYVAKWAQQARK
jgi:D-methionine transport system substrate-binding protein